MLFDQGYTLAFAKNGEEALNQAARLKPDIILLDLNMPRMDGYQVLDVLKADRDLKAIPVIILTGLEVLITALQAFIFATLTSFYIADALETSH